MAPLLFILTICIEQQDIVIWLFTDSMASHSVAPPTVKSYWSRILRFTLYTVHRQIF